MDPPKRLLEKARRLAREGDTGPEAVKVNTAILEIDPTWVGAYTRRGVCYFEQGDLVAAEKDFRRALELHPNNRIALNRLGDIENIRNGRKTKAESTAVRAVARNRGRHNVYVVELNRTVLRENKFLAANPKRDSKKPCLYVGLTGLTPEERFENHKKNHKASRYVRDYGERLLPHLYERFNPMPYAEAVRKEIELTEKLRNEGYAVWSN
jgi:tetratricopeptide (TPR) repeat protein